MSAVLRPHEMSSTATACSRQLDPIALVLTIVLLLLAGSATVLVILVAGAHGMWCGDSPADPQCEFFRTRWFVPGAVLGAGAVLAGLVAWLPGDRIVRRLVAILSAATAVAVAAAMLIENL